MNLVLQIPDDVADRLADAGDIEWQALEALGLEADRSGRLTRPKLRRMLGFGSRAALDGFLVAHGVFGTYGEEYPARDRQDLQRVGL